MSRERKREGEGGDAEKQVSNLEKRWGSWGGNVNKTCRNINLCLNLNRLHYQSLNPNFFTMKLSLAYPVTTGIINLI